MEPVFRRRWEPPEHAQGRVKVERHLAAWEDRQQPLSAEAVWGGLAERAGELWQIAAEALAVRVA
jgi:hypothetical protein